MKINAEREQGIISSARNKWRTANDDSSLKTYSYYYDHLNRITRAAEGDGKYNLGSIAAPVLYDRNGNITRLHRWGWNVEEPNLASETGFGIMDQLSYTYNGNQLMKVDDAAGIDRYGFRDDVPGSGPDSSNDYTYDDNGNMTSDTIKGITDITYNHLNLPVDVEFNGSSSQTIRYTYDATGVKLRKEVPGKTTDYAGNFVYDDLGGTMELQFFNTSEGYVSYDGGQFNYVYNYVDHLGNVRLSYTDGDGDGSIDPATEIVQEKNYYPFGLTHQSYNGGGSSYGNDAAKGYGFGGKELQSESISGNILDWYDFRARNYDPALGRWMNIDPLAEKFNEWSPYNYTYNNPLNFIDPTGMGPEDIRIWGKDENDNDILLVNLVSEEIDTDIKTDIKIPKAVGDVIKGHDPVTNKVNETESGAIIETDLDPLLEKAISSLPDKNAVPMLSIGFEYAAGKGESYSLDLAFMHDNSKIDALAVYGTSGKGYGLSAGAGVSGGFLTARDGGPLSLESISGKSNIFSVAIPGIPGGGSYISNDTYTGKLYSLGGKGAGVSKMSTTSTLKGGWGNLSKYF